MIWNAQPLARFEFESSVERFGSQGHLRGQVTFQHNGVVLVRSHGCRLALLHFSTAKGRGIRWFRTGKQQEKTQILELERNRKKFKKLLTISAMVVWQRLDLQELELQKPSLDQVNEAASHHWVEGHVHHVRLTTSNAEGLPSGDEVKCIKGERERAFIAAQAHRKIVAKWVFPGVKLI